MIYLAHVTSKGEAMPPLRIEATEPFPKVRTREEAERLHEQAAGEIFEALVNSLPGGTWDHLIAKMIQRHASILAVRRPPDEAATDQSAVRRRTEYRVTWKRVGCRPKSKRFAGQVSAERFLLLFGPEPWTYYLQANEGPDDYACCSGHQCGCGGETYRERSDGQRAKQPGLEYVRLQVRQADPWGAVPSGFADAAILSDFAGRN